jgi:hypothetical protein
VRAFFAHSHLIGGRTLGSWWLALAGWDVLRRLAGRSARS